MKIVKAMDIFENINNEKYTETEKAEAIYIVMKMPTHNRIKKDSMLKVINWLWDGMYELTDKQTEDRDTNDP